MFFFLEKTFPFTHPRSENKPFFNAFFPVNSVKMSLFVSRQMNWKALFSVTFDSGNRYFRNPGASQIYHRCLKIGVVSVDVWELLK